VDHVVRDEAIGRDAEGGSRRHAVRRVRLGDEPDSGRRAASSKSYSTTCWRTREGCGAIATAAIDLQQAERRASELRGLPQALAAAEKEAAAAKERYQQLLDKYRRDFLFPDTADQRAMESVAADYLVDGLALLKLRKDGELTFGRDGPPEPGSQHYTALQEELAALGDAVDAVSDALMAESVYHVVRGNPLRTASTIAPDDLAAVEETARRWLQWYETFFSEPEVVNPSWLPDRMEYAFSVGTRFSDGECVLTAQEYFAGHLD
jgi:hypothetical protein